MSIVRPKIHVSEEIQDNIIVGATEIINELKEKIKNSNKSLKIAFECYPVTNELFLLEHLIQPLEADKIISSQTFFKDPKWVNEKIADNLTEDRIFGLMSHHSIRDFVDETKLKEVNNELKISQLSVIYGVGASLIDNLDIIIYVDLARWEIQKRYRTGAYSNWLADNAGEDPLRMIKRGYFFEWQVADKHKQEIFDKVSYFLDIHDEGNIKLLSKEIYFEALAEVNNQPFSLVPFFDPGIWGGSWMQEKFNIMKDEENLAWSFNGVPEENSIILDFNNQSFEMPANNLVYLFPERLLGTKVFGRFGKEFPIRFNFLDTMGGQNLSLQVHPKISYVQDVFGAHYTQDESYYVLEASDDAVVYLGVNDGIEKNELVDALRKAETGAESFDDEKYIYRHPMRKHDHYLIPSGTIHSSGKDSVVLEISATPNRYTFKLWDWDRVDFDGLPRPVNIDHGEKNIDVFKNKSWVDNELVNQFEKLADGDGWFEERTGLHESEFIETRRHTFSKKVRHFNPHGVNVLNLVEGQEALVTSPTNQFSPFKIEYAQTFIIPAMVEEYAIEPTGKSKGEVIKTIKAYIR